MSKKHADALKAKTRELPQFATKTFLTQAKYPNEPTRKVEAPYIVWHPSNGVNTQERATGPRVSKHPRFTGHIVGESAEQVLILLDVLEAHLFPGGRGITINVAGERPKPLWFLSPLPVQVQTDPQPTVIYAVVEVGWQADPA